MDPRDKDLIAAYSIAAIGGCVPYAIGYVLNEAFEDKRARLFGHTMGTFMQIICYVKARDLAYESNRERISYPETCLTMVAISIAVHGWSLYSWLE